ncbi:MAG TPA: zinc-binding dehydrogenase [Candidatus Binataceae bacterium]|nr:zinc-binding dehydrogenase [Candidatus Binataceae bacterium]
MRNHKLVVADIAQPKPEAGEVLVKTLACGICGSDLHALKHGERMVAASRQSGAPFVMDLKRDVVMGHEFCAEIVDFGPATERRFKPGQRVCSIPAVVRPTGVEGIGYSNDCPGGYGEYMRLTEALLLPVPDGVPTEHAALTEPMAVGCHAVEKARLTKDDVALVIGCGPVGLAVIAALKLKRAHPIVAADFSPRRRELAQKLGADVVVDPKQQSPFKTWAQMASVGPGTPGLPPGLGGPALKPAVIFECVGVPGMIESVMNSAPRDARVVVAGVCMERDSIEPFFGIAKELNIQFVLGYSPDEFAATLRNIAEGRIDVAPLITGRVGVDGVAKAFEDLASPDTHAKILVEPWHS